MFSLKSWLEGDDFSSWGNRRTKLLIVILAAVGVLFILWPLTSKTGKAPVKVETDETRISALTPNEDLAELLSEIAGVGEVRVRINYKSDGFRSYASNERHETRTTEETDKSGTVRNVIEENTDRELVLSNNAPVLQEVKAPEVIGVLVVAEGAADAAVQEELISAVTSLLGITPAQVTVLPMEKGGINDGN